MALTQDQLNAYFADPDADQYQQGIPGRQFEQQLLTTGATRTPTSTDAPVFVGTMEINPNSPYYDYFANYAQQNPNNVHYGEVTNQSIFGDNSSHGEQLIDPNSVDANILNAYQGWSNANVSAPSYNTQQYSPGVFSGNPTNDAALSNQIDSTEVTQTPQQFQQNQVNGLQGQIQQLQTMSTSGSGKSGIMSVLGPVLALAAAPFTGGASAYLGLTGLIGETAGAALIGAGLGSGISALSGGNPLYGALGGGVGAGLGANLGDISSAIGQQLGTGVTSTTNALAAVLQGGSVGLAGSGGDLSSAGIGALSAGLTSEAKSQLGGLWDSLTGTTPAPSSTTTGSPLAAGSTTNYNNFLGNSGTGASSMGDYFTSSTVPTDTDGSIPDYSGGGANTGSILSTSNTPNYSSFLGNSGSTDYGLNSYSGDSNSSTGNSGINTGDSTSGGGSLLSSLGSVIGKGATSFLSPQTLGLGANALTNYLASQNQSNAANNASNTQLQMFQQTQQNLSPFIQAGQGANAALAAGTGLNTANPLSSPLLQAPTANLSEAALEQTPGYQFNLYQGLKGLQNSYAAQGLGSSGAAVKGAEQYATGLADSTYQNQYNNAVTNQTNQFNRLLSLSELGQSSAAGLGNTGQQTASNIGNNTIQAANAGSAALTGTGNALSNYGLSSPYYQAATNAQNAQSNYYNSLTSQV